MDVIIVSKTRMAHASCVGGIFDNGRFVRLLDSNGYNQNIDTKLNIGDVYTISFNNPVGRKAPHNEDILVTSMKLKSSFSTSAMVKYLIEKIKIKIWRGSMDILFDGKLDWTDNGSGYISENGTIPANSVGFWIPDKDLRKSIFREKVRYNYPKPGFWRSLPYVGFEEPIETISTGILVRVSLARWWDTKGTTEKRCSLQLSGWYDFNKGSQTTA